MPREIQTVVVLDLETTDLMQQDIFPRKMIIPGDPKRDHTDLLRRYMCTGKVEESPYITEISLISASRRQILHAIEYYSKKKDGNTQDSSPTSIIPHVACNVHTRQVRPDFRERNWEIYERKRKQSSVLHYSRDDLEDKNSFLVEWIGVMNFLSSLPKPACIIAHNGSMFDFRVLHAELERCNMVRCCPMPSSIYLIDSFLMFIDLEKKFHVQIQSHLQEMMRNSPSLPSGQLPENETKCGNSVCRPNAEDFSDELVTTDELDEDSDDEEPTIMLGKSVGYNERTAVEPSDMSYKLQLHSPPPSPCKRPVAMDAESLLQQMRADNWPVAKKQRTRPNFFKKSEEGDWLLDNHATYQYFNEKRVFRLGNMYKQLIGTSFMQHYSKYDCEALLRVCIAYGNEFLEYIDENAAPSPF